MRLWFYLKDGQQKGTGPIAEDILLKMFSTGALSVDTLVWTSGMGEWKAARDVEVLSPSGLKQSKQPLANSRLASKKTKETKVSGLKQSKQPLANNQNNVIKTVPVKARSVAIVKRELEASYTSMFQMMLGCSSSEAREMFEDMFESAKTNALQSGEIELPENYGDIRLEMGLQDKNLQKKFSMLKKDGVRDDDIRWWGNMHQLEREMMIQTDLFARYAYYSNLIQNHRYSKDNAIGELRKTHPMFGDPEDTTQPSGEDRPLPYELKDRINIFLERLSQKPQSEIDNTMKDIQKHSSYNAFIRNEIRKGNL